MRKVTLGEILNVHRGTSLSGEYYATSGRYKRLTLGNFNYPGGGFKENTAKADIFFTGSVKPEFILKKGAIITPLTEQVRGLLGETARIPEDDLYIQSGDVGLIIPDEKVLDPSYAYYLISSPVVKAQLDAASQQTKIRHTSPEAIKCCIAWIPELDDQKRIGALLNSINEKIFNNNAIISELESMTKDIYDYWFVQFDFPDENGKPYKSSGGKMVWNEELKREIPEGWKTTNIGSITTCHDSKRIPLSGKERDSMKGEIPYYGATGIMDYVNRPLFSGDYVLLAEDGSIMNDNGKPIIQRVSGDVWINNHAHVLEPQKGISCRLLMLILGEIDVVRIKTGSIQMKINQENLNKWHTCDIPLSLIRALNKILDPIDSAILQSKEENKELSSLRNWLLPMLMNGQVKIGKKNFEYEQTAPYMMAASKDKTHLDKTGE